MSETLLVVNKPKDMPVEIPGVKIITAKDYLSRPEYIDLKGAKVFNLCRNYAYQSTGYYISLLAQARGHRVIPSITTIQDSKTPSIVRLRNEEMEELIQQHLENIETKKFTLNVYFGSAFNPAFKELGRQLYSHFPCPALKAFFTKRKNKWLLQDVDPISTNGLTDEEKDFAGESARKYFNMRRPAIKKPVFFAYEMGILVNPNEIAPPSNKAAINNFIKAAKDLGIGAYTIGKEDYGNIKEYDAIFIRETTYVNHYSYRFARRAAIEGLVVMDDPDSIMRCSNKVYLAELLERHNINTPRTMVIHKDNVGDIMNNFQYPVILKLPDSCFSKGVKKAETKEELDRETKRMLHRSDLIIAQEYSPTDFDWRIGIVDKKPLYACKYYMAKDHWQIADWQEDTKNEGAHETFPIDKVPADVIQTALKAANLIGNSLYGVDLKIVDGKSTIIEINDNPNIDAGTEDEILKEELYHKLMEVFLKRIKKSKEV